MPSNGSLNQRFAGLAVARTEGKSQTQETNARQSQTAASLKRNQLTGSAKPDQKQGPLRCNVHDIPFSSRVTLPAPCQLRRNVTVASTPAEGPELGWLSSKNRGNKEVSIQISSELLIAPHGKLKQPTQNFLRDIARNHNDEIDHRYPQMWPRELGDGGFPLCWEIIPLEQAVDPPRPGSPRKYQLKTPVITLSDHWLGFYQATWSYLRKYYMIQGQNGLLPAVSIQVLTFERALDFKRIVQALIHFNPLWPKVFSHDDKDPDKAEPRISVGRSYLSHHPDYWSAMPAAGIIFFHIRIKSKVGESSIPLTQFVMTFVMAAVDSPSLAHIQSHPATQAGLDRFVLKDPLGYL